jgi:hypothetical protein
MLCWHAVQLPLRVVDADLNIQLECIVIVHAPPHSTTCYAAAAALQHFPKQLHLHITTRMGSTLQHLHTQLLHHLQRQLHFHIPARLHLHSTPLAAAAASHSTFFLGGTCKGSCTCTLQHLHIHLLLEGFVKLLSKWECCCNCLASATASGACCSTIPPLAMRLQRDSPLAKHLHLQQDYPLAKQLQPHSGSCSSTPSLALQLQQAPPLAKQLQCSYNKTPH